MKILTLVLIVLFSSFSYSAGSYEETYYDSDEYTGGDRIDIGTDTLYSIERTHATWDEAFEKCKSKGINGQLASIDSSYTTHELETYVKNVGRQLWIGIRKGPSGTLMRTGNAQSNYTNWDAREPNDLGKEDCVEILNWSMKWNDLQCNFKRFYLCAYDKVTTLTNPKLNSSKISSTSMTASSNFATSQITDKELSSSNMALTSRTTLPSSATLQSNSLSSMSAPSVTLTDSYEDTYHDSDEYTGGDRIDIGTDTLYSIERTHATWDEAFEKCKLKGINGQLASIDSRYTTHKLETYVKNVGRPLWIGIRKGPSGKFIRIGNAQSNYINWDAREPNELGKEDCVEIYNWNMKWNDLDCNFQRFYLCAYDKVSTSTNPELNSSKISSTSMTTSSNFATSQITDKELSSSNMALTSRMTLPSSATLQDHSLSSMSAPSVTLTDIAKESHANLIATSFLIVFLFLVFLVSLVLRRWPLTPKVISSDNESLL